MAADQQDSISNGTEQQESQRDTETFWDRFELHASLSQGYLYSNKNNWVAKTEGGTFDFNEFAVNLSVDLTDSLRAGFQLMSRDFGPLMNNKVVLDWATLEYRWSDSLQITGGRVKTPFALYNASRDVDSARISILLPLGVYPERARDQAENIDGVALHGLIPLGKAGSVEYFTSYGNKKTYKEGESVHFFEMNSSLIDSGSTSHTETNNIICLRLFYDTPIDGLHLAGSYGQADFTLEGRSSIGGVPGGPASIWVPDAYSWIGSLEYVRDNFIFAAEYRYLKANDQEFTFLHAKNGMVTAVRDTPSMGWYVSSSYRFTDWFAAEVYYSEIYPDTSDRDGKHFVATGQDDFLAWQKDISMTGRFDITDNWILKAGVTFSNGLAGGFPADYPIAGIASEDWILYQLKATFVF